MRSYVYINIKYFKSICISEGYKCVSLSGIIKGNCNIFPSLYKILISDLGNSSIIIKGTFIPYASYYYQLRAKQTS